MSAGSGGGEGGGGLTCDLSFQVDLSGIDVEILAKCASGDILLVGANEAAVLCRTIQGEIVGSIIGAAELSTLIYCLTQGVGYEATIIEISDFQCTVRIENS